MKQMPASIVHFEQAVSVEVLCVCVNSKAAFSVQASKLAVQAEALYAQTDVRQVPPTGQYAPAKYQAVLAVLLAKAGTMVKPRTNK